MRYSEFLGVVHAIVHTGVTVCLPNTKSSEFEVHFMYQGSENTWLPFISHCVLNSVDVDYGGAQYQTFRPMQKPGGDGSEAPPPTTINMTLSFTESEIMTKEKVVQGF